MTTLDSINLFNECINRLLENETAVQYEKFQLESMTDHMPIGNIVEHKSNESTKDYILISLAFEGNCSDCDETESARSTVNSSSVIGSPLRLRDFQSELRYRTDDASPRTPHRANLAHLRPVSVSDARRLISMYNVFNQQRYKRHLNADQWPPVWVITDGLDAEKTAFISSSFEISGNDSNENSLRGFPDVSNGTINGGDKPSTDGLDYSNQRFTIKTFSVNVTGPLTKHCKLPTNDSLIRNNSMKKEHSTSYLAKYELIGRAMRVSEKSLSSSDGTTLCHGSVDASVLWESKSMLLDEPPVDASAVLSVTAVSGDPRSSAHDLYSELCTLQGLCSGLTDGLVKWSVVDSDTPLIERVKQLIDDQKLGDAVRETSTAIGGSIDDGSIPMKHLQLADRKDLDFSEHLWNILRDCSSYADLVDCLQYVVDCLLQGNLQPMIHKQNKTKLAEIVRESYYGRLVPSILSHVSPLQLLVEVGFDKLLRDYTHMFLVKDLVTMNHLKWFLVDKEDATHASRLCRIEKLHRVLEMVVMLEQYLMLPRLQLCSAARQALKFYETHPLNSYDVFTLSIPIANISSLIKSCRPYLWKVNLESSSSKHGKLKAAIAFTMSAPFPHFMSLDAMQDVDDDSEMYNGYFVTAVNQFSYDI